MTEEIFGTKGDLTDYISGFSLRAGNAERGESALALLTLGVFLHVLASERHSRVDDNTFTGVKRLPIVTPTCLRFLL